VGEVVTEIGYYRYEGFDLRTKFGWIQGSVGARATEAARVGMGNLGNAFLESDQAIRAALGPLGIEWHGVAADATGRALTQAAERGEATGVASGTGSSAVDGYGRSFEAMRPRVAWEDPGIWDWWEMPVDVVGSAARTRLDGPFAEVFSVQSDYARTIEENRTLDARANEALYGHEQQARTSLASFPVVEPAAAPPAPSAPAGGGFAPGGGTGGGGSWPADVGRPPPPPIDPVAGAPAVGVGGSAGGATGPPGSATPSPGGPGRLPPVTPGGTGHGTPVPPAAGAGRPAAPSGPPLPGSAGRGGPGGFPGGLPAGPSGGAGARGPGPASGGRGGYADGGTPGGSAAGGTPGGPARVGGTWSAGPSDASGRGVPSGGEFGGRILGGGTAGEPAPVGRNAQAPGALPGAARATGASHVPFLGGGALGGSEPTEHRTRYWIPSTEAFDVRLPPHTDPVIEGRDE
jgi:hypothetical protein